MSQCAALDCPDQPTTSVQSTVRPEPLPVCHKHSPAARGCGAELIFQVRPDCVEKKP